MKVKIAEAIKMINAEQMFTKLLKTLKVVSLVCGNTLVERAGDKMGGNLLTASCYET